MKTIRKDIYDEFVKRQYSLTSRRGQNYLKNPDIIKCIIEHTLKIPSNTIVEIGTGPGILTIPLAETGRKIISYEIDKGVYEITRGLENDYPNLKIINADFLQCSIPEKDFSVVANIPYNITSDILNKIFTESEPDCAIIMVQKEFATKIISGNPVNSQTVFFRTCFETELLKQVSKNDFFPPPKVNSSIIKLSTQYDKTFLKSFYTFLKDIFSFRNKNLGAFYKKKNIKTKYLDLTTRKIQSLESRNFLNLFKELDNYPE